VIAATAFRLRRGAREINVQLVTRHVERRVDTQRTVAEAVLLHRIGSFVAAVGDATDAGTHQPVRVRDERVHRGRHLGRAPPPRQPGQPDAADAQRRELRCEIAGTLRRRAYVRQHDAPDVLDALAAGEQPHRRQSQAFLVDLARQRHRAGRHTADVGMVRAYGNVPDRAAVLTVNRADEREVGQMRAACERIVQQHHIAGAERPVRVQRRGYAQRQRAQMHRHVVAHRHHPAGAVEKSARVVAPLLDVRRVRRSPQRRAHLLRERRVEVAIHLQPDRIECRCRTFHDWPVRLYYKVCNVNFLRRGERWRRRASRIARRRYRFGTEES
jgi:hypothetical protein